MHEDVFKQLRERVEYILVGVDALRLSRRGKLMAKRSKLAYLVRIVNGRGDPICRVPVVPLDARLK